MIEVKDLTVRYGPVTALDGISLCVERGEFVLISGPSGCGKSTLARALAGLLSGVENVRVTGTVRVAGLDVLECPAAQVARHVGMVFQNPGTQLFSLTVEEEVAFGPRNLGLPEGEVQRRVEAALDALGLTRLRERPTGELSGGEAQRLAIAAVLAMGPEVLILDEPTSSLDVDGTRQVVAALDGLRKRGITILLIEHKLGDVARLAGRTLLMESGRIVADGPSDEVLSDRALLRRLGMRRPASEPVTDWERLLRENGLTPRDETPLLSLRGVVAGYGKREVLHGVDLDIWPGEWMALIGENGAGKTTLALVAAGLLRPRRGSVLRRDEHGILKPMRVKKPGLDVGLLLQNPLDQLFCAIVDEEVAFGPMNYDRFDQFEHDKLLARCGLERLRRRPVHALSAGQQQRTTLAAVLALCPELVILDEPTMGQDWGHLERLMEFLLELNRGGTAVLLITHDYKLVHHYARRVALMRAGRIVADGLVPAREEVMSDAIREVRRA